MWISEQILFFLAKQLYSSNLGHSVEMKEALSDRDEYNCYRTGKIQDILEATRNYGVEISDKTILDLGCNDGAITEKYVEAGAKEVVGVDIDAVAIERARSHCLSPQVSFRLGTISNLPLPDDFADGIICYDVFEHVSDPAAILSECHRVLKPHGKMLIGTWGWNHPFAPHLWSTMPVPWAHVFFSEQTLLRTCRRVYQSEWYVPNMHDLDEFGQKIKGKYVDEEISTDYLNKLYLRDFERIFEESHFQYSVFPKHFGSKYARWTRVFLKTPWIREFVTGYFWVVLTRDGLEPAGTTSVPLPRNA